MMSWQSAEGSNDRRRVVILLVSLGIIALLGVLYVVLSSGGDSTEQSAQSGTEAGVVDEESDAVIDTVEQSDQVLVTSTSRRDPFEPLVQDTGGSQPDTSSSKTTGKNSSNPPKTSSTTKKQTQPDRAPATDSTPSSKSPSSKTKPKSDKPGPATPVPIDTGKGASADEILVRVVEVQPDALIARVNGDRTNLYLNVPAEISGLTYLSPLGGGCAWIGRTGSEIRVSVCKGKAERV